MLNSIFNVKHKNFINILICSCVLFHCQKKFEKSDIYKIEIRINYSASLFKIVDDLSRWSPYCEEEIYEYWSKNFIITPSQSSMLLEYAKIRQNYDWGYFESCFLTNPNLDESIVCISNKIGRKNINLLKELIFSFKVDFDSLWNSDNYLVNRKKQIDVKLKEIDTDELLSTIFVLFNYQNPPRTIDFNLLFNPVANNSDGGANGGIYIRNGKNISIEDDLMVLFHEFTHTVSDSLNQLLFKIARQKGISDNFDLNILHEAIDYTLFPAYFYEKYLGKPFDLNDEVEKFKDKNKYLYLIYKTAGQIYPDVKQLIQKKESFNQNILLKLVEYYSEDLRKQD
jgi:hypothetical protein